MKIALWSSALTSAACWGFLLAWGWANAITGWNPDVVWVERLPLMIALTGVILIWLAIYFYVNISPDTPTETNDHW
jgi:hypothetical protein